MSFDKIFDLTAGVYICSTYILNEDTQPEIRAIGVL